MLELTRRHPVAAAFLNARPTLGGTYVLALLGDDRSQADLAALVSTAPAQALYRESRSVAYLLSPEHPLRTEFPIDDIQQSLQQSLKADFVHDPLAMKAGWLTLRVFNLRGIPPRQAVEELQACCRRLNMDFRLVTLSSTDLTSPTVPTEALTEKQLKTIKAAKALGFYDTPKRANLDTLAQIFGVSKAAVHSRLKAAERKIITEFTDRL
ncbi:MAG TPA: helix-turn-helix domain-containing protein [Candidatus Thermoplasmatota archaeon]|nr:helix-turn-helix domain-containing protein [Candidatus Thermoplasmatota archaeon]